MNLFNTQFEEYMSRCLFNDEFLIQRAKRSQRSKSQNNKFKNDSSSSKHNQSVWVCVDIFMQLSDKHTIMYARAQY
jgi:hypothetical protein